MNHPPPLPILMMSFNNNKRCEHIFQAKNREVKTSSSALFISFTEKEIFQFFYPAYPKKKKSVVWHLLSSKKRKITKLYVYEWRKRRHAPIVMHKIIVFLKTYYGKYIYAYTYVINMKLHFCLNRLCHHPPPHSIFYCSL